MLPFWMPPEFQPAQPHGCVGHFFDNKTKKSVTTSLGYVVARPVLAFRAETSPLVEIQKSPFVGGEVSAQKATADGCTGSIVIPVQHTPQGIPLC